MTGIDQYVDTGRAVANLKRGGIVLCPTDTVWGLLCDFDNPKAVAHIFELKKSRPKPLAILCAGVEHVRELKVRFTTAGLNIARQFWPGPVTLVLERDSNCKDAPYFDKNTIGVRVPDSEDLKELIIDFGGRLAATSANYSGERPASIMAHIPEKIVSGVDCICHLNNIPTGIASTIVDCTSETIRLIREGAVCMRDIQKAAGVYD